MQLHIRVGVGSTRVEIVGGRKTKWGRNSYWGVVLLLGRLWRFV